MNVMKQTTVYQLQCKISSILHDGAVFPEDIIIYKRVAIQKLVDVQNDGWANEPVMPVFEWITVPCNDTLKMIGEYFPDVDNFQMPDAKEDSLHRPADFKLGLESITYPTPSDIIAQYDIPGTNGSGKISKLANSSQLPIKSLSDPILVHKN